VDDQPGLAETVAGLRRPRPGDPTVEVLLASGERIRVHDRRLAEHGLAVGETLDPAACAALRDAGRADAAEGRALRLIAVRPRSRAELARRMGEWGLSEEAAAAVLERLAAIGAVDDGVLAAAVVSSRRAHAYGRLRVEADLERLRVDPAARALAGTDAGDEAERARRALAARGSPDAGDPAGLRRAAGYLQRRGFDADTVAAVLGLEVD
jgi:SOS response regulatory protein OraA/RecX